MKKETGAEQVPAGGGVKAETNDELALITAEAKTLTFPTESIPERTTGRSAMPADLIKQLNRMEPLDAM